MEMPYFQHLRIDIDALPPELAEHVKTIISLPPWMTRPHSYPDFGLPILQSCLLQIKPFQTDNDDTIRVDSKRADSRTCLDRSGLICRLTWLLWQYEEACSNPAMEAQSSSHHIQDALDTVIETVESFLNLRKHKDPAVQNKHLPYKNNRIEDALQIVADVTLAAAGMDVQSRQHLPTARKKARFALARAMQDAFTRHVQEVTDTEIRNIIATILAHFGIEKGEESKISDRHRKRRERARSSKR